MDILRVQLHLHVLLSWITKIITQFQELHESSTTMIIIINFWWIGEREFGFIAFRSIGKFFLWLFLLHSEKFSVRFLCFVSERDQNFYDATFDVNEMHSMVDKLSWFRWELMKTRLIADLPHSTRPDALNLVPHFESLTIDDIFFVFIQFYRFSIVLSVNKPFILLTFTVFNDTKNLFSLNLFTF